MNITICVQEIALKTVLNLELQKRGTVGAAKVVKLILRYTKSWNFQVRGERLIREENKIYPNVLDLAMREKLQRLCLLQEGVITELSFEKGEFIQLQMSDHRARVI